MIKFGVAGYPIAFGQSKYKQDRMKIFDWLQDLNLDALELQMTYGPRTSKENCELIKSLSSEFNIAVSAHAAYYIVLTSDDKEKVRRSIDTLKRTYEATKLLGGKKVILHPGPLYKKDPKIIFERLSDNLELFFKEIGDTDIELYLETAGKKGQLGSVDDVIELSRRFKGCHPCIDFGHVHARAGGILNNKKAIDSLFQKLEKNGLFSKDKKIHFHYTPIDFGPKGELKHKAIDDKYPENEKTAGLLYHPRLEPIIENMIKLDHANFTVISETHNSQEIGATEMKKYYNLLKAK
ncbi:MAG: TIM barrel protein [Proteobacteria bacterium]|nr:TIM barrel protein [Pseudomonadota bacterium]